MDKEEEEGGLRASEVLLCRKGLAARSRHERGRRTRPWFLPRHTCRLPENKIMSRRSLSALHTALPTLRVKNQRWASRRGWLTDRVTAGRRAADAERALGPPPLLAPSAFHHPRQHKPPFADLSLDLASLSPSPVDSALSVCPNVDVVSDCFGNRLGLGDAFHTRDELDHDVRAFPMPSWLVQRAEKS